MLKRLITIKAFVVLGWLLLPLAASASLLQSSHYQLDPNTGSSFGGTGSSNSYKLTDAGGEAVVGAGSSQSYKLTQGFVAHLQHSLQLSVMPSGTYAYWPLDTGSGIQAYDVSTTGDNGVLQAAPSWATGKVGQAVTLNGSSQYISTSTTQASPSPLTVELWFKTTTAQGGELIGFGNAQTGASSTADRLIYMTNAGKLVFGVKPSGFTTITSGLSYNDGAWHHVAATLGASGLSLVIDGLPIATSTTTTAASYTGYWRLGFDSLTGWPNAPTSNFFAGSIDEARVYTRQLSNAEIAGDYTAGSNGLRFAHVLPNVTSGTSTTYSVDAVVQTDAPGYDLFVQAARLLTHTDNVTTIPMMAGTVGSPTAWTEGVTKGLGFTVTGGSSVEAKWGTGPYNYAGVPLVSTNYHSRSGTNGGVAEKTTLQYRADTVAGQKYGTYSTTIIYTATLKP